MAYTSVTGVTKTERVVEKSRFIAYVAHAEGEAEAREALCRIRAEHPLATHVCWAYIADKTGNEQRFSDDGEPQGTAGMPILNVIKAQKLFEVLVAVVRYFGGIKLGAGGLVRAYSASAAEGCEAAPKKLFDRCVECSVRVDYPQTDAALRYFSGARCEVLSQEYGLQAVYTVAVREEEFPAFSEKLTDYLNGKAEIFENNRYFYPFALENRE